MAAISADAAHRHRDHGRGKRGGDGRVDGIAALGQDTIADFGALGLADDESVARRCRVGTRGNAADSAQYERRSAGPQELSP